MKNKVLVLLFFFSAPSFLLAQKDSLSGIDTLLQLSPEQLMNIQVVTASGFAQTTAEAPSTITVLTDKEIKERAMSNWKILYATYPESDMIHLKWLC